jgi:hypothetical protein
LQLIDPGFIFRTEFNSLIEVIMKKISLFLLILFFASCQKAPIEASLPGVNQPFELVNGESITLTQYNIQVGFDSVLSESRCPIGVRCFWEGEASIKLWLTGRSIQKTYCKVSIHGYTGIEDTLHHRYVDTLGYRIKLMELDPYPQYPVPNDYKKYKATLLVTQER